MSSERTQTPGNTRYSQREIDDLLAEELGSQYVEYRKIWNASGPTNIPRFPIHIDFEVNDMCNQRCVFCPRNTDKHPDVSYPLNTGRSLHFDDYKRVIDEGADKGLLSVNLGAFAEPLLHPKLFDMIAYAHQCGIIDSRLITNGILLDRHLDPIFRCGLVNLFVSLDAYSEEKYRCVRGNFFDKVCANILLFLEERKRRGVRLPIVRVSFIDMKNTREEQVPFVRYWEDKVDFIDIQTFADFNTDMVVAPDLNSPKKWDCGSPWSRLAVRASGDILPCCSFFGCNIPVGNIKDMSIEEAWTSDTLHNIRYGVLHDTLHNCSICQRTSG